MGQTSDASRRIFSSQPDPTILFGLIDGRIEDANDAALAMYGYAREEMIGLPLTALSADPSAKLHKRKDGSLLAIEASHTTLKHEGREKGVSVIRELSEPVDRRAPAEWLDIARSIGVLVKREFRGLFPASPLKD